MPRNLERELLTHSLLRAEIQGRTYAMLRDQLPDRDRALIGWPAILGYLHDVLGLRRLNGGPLTARIVRRWARDREFPLVRGNRCQAFSTLCVTTAFAVTAWTLTAFAHGFDYRVALTGPQPNSGCAPAPACGDDVQRNAA